MRTFDPDLLRTLVAFADTGTLVGAARAVGRTASTVTAQMQRLEAEAGTPLITPAGRGRALTPAGEVLVGHARRILAAHRDAWLGVAGAAAPGGTVSLGLTGDFADAQLVGLLAAFGEAHPHVRLDLRVGRCSALARAVAEGALDVAVAMRAYPGGKEVAVLAEPMYWLCTPDGTWTRDEAELPLALLDAPSVYREEAIAALERAGRRYRIAATSADLSGMWAAVEAGIAITLRTLRSARGRVGPAPARLGLPALKVQAEASVRVRSLPPSSAMNLAAMLTAKWGRSTS